MKLKTLFPICYNTLFVLFLCLLAHTGAIGQQGLNFYLPEGITYNPSIPVPQAVVGHQVGEWHLSHDKLIAYMQALDKASDRLTLEEIGYTHEGRPLIVLTITSPKNHQNLEALRQQHVALSDAAKSASLDIKTMPVVVYTGATIHGNEASGVQAAVLLAYHLAAAQGPEIEKYLDNTILLLDPCLNPDGVQRFSTWVNSRKSKNLATDPLDTEHNEAWPGGRFNHYWFDLNRDWLVAQHPESQARIKKFLQWRPNLLNDHHEQGTNANFFFMPGVPSRVNPLTPEKNQELTRKIGTYHAKALDDIGSLYFTQEGFDDFYYGKGSTYPDAVGSIGILYEQGSSRGHAQESINGTLSFAFTIRNQFVTMLSAIRAANDMREELLAYQRDFYKNASAEAAKDPVKAYVVGAPKDKTKLFHFAEMALRQQVEVYKPAGSVTVNGKTFAAESSYIIPTNQAQYKLIQGMFYKQTKFKDSIFYDISSWTLPLAFGLDYEEARVPVALGEKVTDLKMAAGNVMGDGDYAYVFEGFGYYTPRAIYGLLRNGIRTKVSTETFTVNGRKFERGSIIVPMQNQDKSPAQILSVLRDVAGANAIDIYAVATGLDYSGVSLGSNSFQVLKKPEIALLVDAGMSATDVGEIWHLLDTRFNIPVTLLPVGLFNTQSISRYNTIILPEGNYSGVTEAAKEKLKAWVQAGGVVIGFENAVPWLHTAGLAKFDAKKDKEGEKENVKARRYADLDEYRGAQETSGAIFEADGDLTHPLLYGYTSPKIPMFKGNNIFMEKANKPYANPLTFGNAPLLSGYISKTNYDKLKNSSCIGVSALGRGRVIGFTENVTFRAFWYGSNKLLMNAIFYGSFISAEAGR
jgi:hypothetical protein